MNELRNLICATASGLAICSAYPAAAQSAGAAPAAGTQSESPTEQTGLQDIIVTAQRRSEDLQRTALQINVVTGDEIAKSGLTQIKDLQSLVPGINIQQAGPYPQFTIRGIGAAVSSPYADPGVAFNLDEVYIARPVGTTATFYDLERVEVLKGPQGTLYGRNATAGAVNVVTAQPRFENSFGANVEYGAFNQTTSSGFANLQVGERSAVRAAFQASRRDGYFDDGFDNERTLAGRIQFRSELTNGLTITLGADASSERGKGFAVVPFPYPGGDAWAGLTSDAVRNFIKANLKPPYSLVTPPGQGTNIANFGSEGRLHHNAWGLRAKADWDVGPAVISVIGAYRSADIDDVGYPGGFITAPNYKSDQFSGEARIASDTPDSPLEWLVGLYYFKETQRGQQTTIFVDRGSMANIIFGSVLTIDPLTDETYAAFTQETLTVATGLRLTAGLRYFKENKINNGSTKSYSPFPPVLGSVVVPGGGELNYTKANYRGSIEYDLAPRSLIYASVANGFKAGGFYLGAPPSSVNPTPNTYRPATLTAYTIGSRNRFLDNRLQLNLEVFYWEYKDRQTINFGPVNTGTAANLSGAITINVGKTHIQGASFDTSFLITPHDLISAVGEYIDEAINDTFVFPSTGAPGIGCTQPSAGVVDCSGSPVTSVPRWSMTVGYQHTFPLESGANIVFGARSKIESSQLLGPERLPTQTQAGYTRSDLDLTYNAEGERFSFGVFVRNVEDRVTRAGGLVSPITGSPWGDLMPPRTYGVRGGFHF